MFLRRADDGGLVQERPPIGPIPPFPLAALRAWRLAAPTSHLDPVSPTGNGSVDSYANLYNRLWCPLLKEADFSDVEIFDGQYRSSDFMLS